MAKLSNPYPSILALVALERLYAGAKGIYRDMSDTSYNQALSAAFIQDSILKKDIPNFVNLFRSKPNESEAGKASGMQTERLDKIAEIVIKHYGLEKKCALPENIKFAWSEFTNRIFYPSPDLKDINNKGYFKYLSADEKRVVEAHLQRRFNELGLSEKAVVNYCMYQWNPDYNHVRCAIITLDTGNRTATLSYFAPDEEKNWVEKSFMRSTSYSLSNTVLHINFVDQDPQKSHVRASLFLTILDATFINLSVLKGVFAVSAHNGTTPMCSSITMEKCDSYGTAYAKVIDDSKKDKLLCLEVVNKRFEAGESNIFKRDRLPSYRLYQTLEDIEGHYLVGFVLQPIAIKGKPGFFSTGYCHIGTDGIVTFYFYEKDGPLKAYVNQNFQRDSDFLCIDYFSNNVRGVYDAQYRFTVERDYENNGIVRAMRGWYSGFINKMLVTSKIVMIKLDTKEDKVQLVNNDKYGYEIKRPLFDSFDEAFKPFKMETIDMNSKEDQKKLNDAEKAVFKLLQDYLSDN